ncbi:uncharacterized protein EDB93DRAFT_1118286 [Suillus bovinus]|uniref:uncharacterized protein n=1 Tax=Suillus bovinus TaxID=48563 RepID=UPI001B8801F3|nr:uncharacterized protein EDB93DRAFT_1118286 [Suillus bovinus]KAG2159134.1 hypothetical protein EDB93DRAFT_1118286 [Suillus bovinus]
MIRGAVWIFLLSTQLSCSQTFALVCVSDGAPLLSPRCFLERLSSHHFVAVDQGNSVIEGRELKCVAQHVAPVVSFPSLEDGKTTVESALDALNHNQ